MISKLAIFAKALQQGQELSDPTTWKNRTVAINALVGLLGAGTSAAVAMGYTVNLPPGTIEATASIIVFSITIINNLMTYATSKKVGLFPAKETDVQE